MTVVDLDKYLNGNSSGRAVGVVYWLGLGSLDSFDAGSNPPVSLIFS